MRRQPRLERKDRLKPGRLYFRDLVQLARISRIAIDRNDNVIIVMVFVDALHFPHFVMKRGICDVQIEL
jgi:hypothetical protein